MNEEQAVLDFFSRAENLPLGLAVAEQMDMLREQMNNRLWLGLQPRLQALIIKHELEWRVQPTEDKNAPGQPGRASLHYEHRAAALLAADDGTAISWRCMAYLFRFDVECRTHAGPTGIVCRKQPESVAAVSRLQEQ